MADIFISYARADRDRVEPLVEILESRGWSVWWDRELMPGSAYERAIDEALLAARVVIVVWSADSVDSEWVQAEAGDGLDRQILVPVLLDEVRVPISFRRKHAARLIGFPTDHDEREVQTLLRGVENCLAGRTTNAVPQTGVPPSTPARRFSWKRRLSVVMGVVIAVTLGFLYVVRNGISIRIQEGSESRAPAQSIAVLPFTGEGLNSQGEVAQLRDEIGRALERLPEMRVVSGWDTESVDPIVIGRQLSVDFIVAGDVTADGATLDLKLINTLNGSEIGADSLSLAPENLVRIPAAAVRLVERPLSLGRGSGGMDPQVSQEAYLAYLNGKAGLTQPILSDSVHRRVTAHFEKAIRLEPRFGPAYAGLCRAYISEYSRTSETGAFDAAERNCNRALTIDPDEKEVLLALGELYRVSGLYDRAILSFERITTLKPYDTEAMRGLSQVYAEMGLVAPAEDMLRTVMQIEPAYWKNHRLLGKLYYRAGRYREAAEEYQLEAELNPNKVAPMLNLGAALYLDGDFEAAVDAWKVSAAIEADAAAYSNIGAAEFFSGDFEAAAEMYERALDLQPRSHAVWGNAAEAYFFQGSEKSREYYQTAYDLAEERLHINPEDYDVLSSQAVYLAALGRGEDALEVLGRAFAQRGNDPFTWYDAARVHARLNDRGEALIALHSAFELGYSRTLASADANFAAFRAEIVGDGK